MRGTWIPEQSWPWEAIGRDEHWQHFLNIRVSESLERGCKGHGLREAGEGV